MRRIYGSARAEELAPVPWTAAEKDVFLDHQFAAQDAHYRAHYPGVQFDVVVLDGEDAGRCYTCRFPSEIRLLDVTLLPPWRNRGIGTQLLTELQAEAAAVGLPVTLFVEASNRARRLYERFGFMPVEPGPVYDKYEWRPPLAQLKTTP